MAGLTKRAKSFYVDVAPGTSLYQVKVERGGQTPNVLKGRFTSRVLATKAINDYLFNGKQVIKVKPNAKSRSK
jgi:hypothetical protein